MMFERSARLVSLLIGAVLVPACAGAPAGTSGVNTAGGASQGDTTNVITGEEIAAVGAATIFEAVDALRPEFLLPMDPDIYPIVASSPVSGGLLLVYIDGVRHVGLDILHEVAAADVTRVEWLPPYEATRRWRVPHPRGGLIVTTSDSGGDGIPLPI